MASGKSFEERVERLEKETPAAIDALRREMHQRFDGHDQRFDGIDQRFDSVEQVLISLQTQITDNQRQMVELNAETRREMTELNAETRRHMLVLHEDLVSRIATLGEASPRRPNGRKKR